MVPDSCAHLNSVLSSKTFGKKIKKHRNLLLPPLFFTQCYYSPWCVYISELYIRALCIYFIYCSISNWGHNIPRWMWVLQKAHQLPIQTTSYHITYIYNEMCFCCAFAAIA